MTTDGTFHLQSEDQSFSRRSSDVFGGLGDIEAKHKAYERARNKFGSQKLQKGLMKEDPQEEPTLPSSRAPIQPSSREPTQPSSGAPTQPSFRVPRGRAPRSRPYGVPDHLRHPERWTKYDLSDTPETMSDMANTAIALQFLDERKRQHTNCDDDDDDDDDDPHMKTSKSSDQDSLEDNEVSTSKRHIFKPRAPKSTESTTVRHGASTSETATLLTVDLNYIDDTDNGSEQPKKQEKDDDIAEKRTAEEPSSSETEKVMFKKSTAKRRQGIRKRHDEDEDDE